MKKKYSKDHMLMLVFIYYFKNLLSFSDIEELFRPITSKHFSGQTSQLSLEDIYNEVFTLEKGEMDNLKSDVAAKFARAQDTFSDAPVDDKDREYLKLFAFICELSFDVYLKTQMIEMIADQLREDAPAPARNKLHNLSAPPWRTKKWIAGAAGIPIENKTDIAAIILPQYPFFNTPFIILSFHYPLCLPAFPL